MIVDIIDALVDNKGYEKADVKCAGEWEVSFLASDGEEAKLGTETEPAAVPPAPEPTTTSEPVPTEPAATDTTTTSEPTVTSEPAPDTSPAAATDSTAPAIL